MDEQSIFTAALKIQDEAERDAYLNTACSGDPPLRERVDKLLRNHPQVGTFMAAPARPAVAPTIAPTPPTEQLGTYIGPYKLNDEIGEGGTVFAPDIGIRISTNIFKPLRTRGKQPTDKNGNPVKRPYFIPVCVDGHLMAALIHAPRVTIEEVR